MRTLNKMFTYLLLVTLVSVIVLGSGCGDSNEDSNVTSNRFAVIETSLGTIKFELYEKRAPITTKNFIELAEEDYYDGLIFHRVINDFMIQTGWGDQVDNITHESHEELVHVDGAVSMANTGLPNSASSQFFICDGGRTSLDGNYAVFGQVVEGMEVVRAIAEMATDTNDKPLEDVKMISVTIQSE